MKFSGFMQFLSGKGLSIMPSSTALPLYSGNTPYYIEVFSTADFLDLIKSDLSYSFQQHPIWDVFFNLDDARVSFKTITKAQLNTIRYNPSEQTNAPIFSYHLPSESYFDPYGTLFNLKYETGAGNIETSSLYYYLKYLLISRELPRYNLSVRYNEPEPVENPGEIEWELFHYMLSHRETAFFIRELSASNVLFRFFPQLKILQKIHQDKDYHPEGNVFEHTIACFTYLKKPELSLALSVLFHDIGKAYSNSPCKEKPFYNHSIISARKTMQALSSDRYSPQFRKQVYYLVRYHMYPPFLFNRSERTIKRITENPAFNELLKLYRADLLSTFRDNSPYQRVIKQYRDYKNLNKTAFFHALD